QWLERATDHDDALRAQHIDGIALHYERGGHAHHAAVAWHQAGQAAARNYHAHAAYTHYERALSWFDERDLARRIDLLHDLGNILELTGQVERSLESFRELLRCAWVLDHTAKVAVGYTKLGRAHISLGNYSTARTLLDRGIALFRQIDDQPGIAACLDASARVHLLLGAYDEAERINNLALDIRRQLGDPRSEALTLNRLGTVKLHRGDFKDALVLFRQSLELRKQVGDRRGVAE
ncbi:MAG: tetratricopeptide repeat protein, partial [Myxococcota bacterium]